MSAPTWERGQVAVVSSRRDGAGVRAIWQGNQWATENALYLSDFQVTARLLVVIDPEDIADEIESIFCDCKEFDGHRGDCHFFAIQRGLREFANPTPPKPDEPMGLGAVVEDEDGGLWVRVEGPPRAFTWRPAGNGSDYSDTRYWSRVNAVRVLSEGVTS